MTAKEWENKLQAEGFKPTFVWSDGPSAHYPDHTHGCLTAHIILDGEMTLTFDGQTRTCKAGDRIDVPAHTVHSAKMGPAGCRYLLGEQ